MKTTFKALWLFLLVETTSSLNGGELAFSFSLAMCWIRIPEVEWKEAEIVYVWLFYFNRTLFFMCYTALGMPNLSSSSLTVICKMLI